MGPKRECAYCLRPIAEHGVFQPGWERSEECCSEWILCRGDVKHADDFGQSAPLPPEQSREAIHEYIRADLLSEVRSAHNEYSHHCHKLRRNEAKPGDAYNERVNWEQAAALHWAGLVSARQRLAEFDRLVAVARRIELRELVQEFGKERDG